MEMNLVVNEHGKIDTDSSMMHLEINGNDKMKFEFRGDPNQVADALYNLMYKSDEVAIMLLKVTTKFVKSKTSNNV